MIQNLSRSSYNHPCNPASWSCIGRTQGKPNCTTKISVASGLFRFVRRQLPLVSHNLYCNWNVSFPFFLWKVKRISSHACTTAYSFEATQLTGLQLKRMIRSKMLVPICSFLHDQKCSFEWCFFSKLCVKQEVGQNKRLSDTSKENLFLWNMLEKFFIKQSLHPTFFGPSASLGDREWASRSFYFYYGLMFIQKLE